MSKNTNKHAYSAVFPVHFRHLYKYEMNFRKSVFPSEVIITMITIIDDYLK